MMQYSSYYYSIMHLKYNTNCVLIYLLFILISVSNNHYDIFRFTTNIYVYFGVVQLHRLFQTVSTLTILLAISLFP